ncbi:MAG TPA: class I SAM-dependent methyltransferase [Burkholderiaceae bacterium]|nr:class I SAM-dependent methyltransferase [Burkholderiaceae bacterium]
MQATLTLKPGKDRPLLRRHPWIFAGGVARVQGNPAPGDTVRVVSAEGRFLGWGAFSPASSIRARMWSFDEHAQIDDDWIAARVAAAVGRRADLSFVTDAVRLVFGEGDGLPGVVVDRYGGQLVVQLMSAGAERWRDAIVAGVRAVTGLDDVYERSDAAAREREGLPIREGVICGAAPGAALAVTEHGVRYLVDVPQGHKTGFYIDQRDSRREVARHAAGRAVLNCFSYTGGFSLAALAGGAASVLSIDSSGPALARAAEQQALNGQQSAQCEWREADVFESLKQMVAAGQRFDLIVLDPPKFAPSVHHVDKAARAYKEINLKAMRLLNPGGMLFTFSCSGAIDVDLFQKIVAGAVFDAQVDVQMLRRLQAGEDHPMLMTHPEGEYLKGLLLQRI